MKSRRPNKRLRTYLLLLFLLLLTATRLTGQEVSDFTYSHLGQTDGMNSQRIYSIRQTSDGALWWSTKKGVERYNGVVIRPYQLGDTENYSRFAGRSIRLVPGCDDRPGQSRLMAFDNSGNIFTYNAVCDGFVQDAAVGELLGGEVVLNDILVTADGIWLAMREGIFFLRDRQLITVRKGVFANDVIQAGKTILFCTKAGVLAWHSRQAMPKAGEKMQTVVSDNVETGFYDAKYNKVWLGCFGGGIKVLTSSPEGKLTHCESVAADDDIARNPVRMFCPYDDHTMLAGIDGLGVYKMNRRATVDGRYRCQLLFDANEGTHGVLHGNGVYALIRDIWGNIIIGSYSGGIDIARPVGSTPAVFQHIRWQQQSLLNDHVNCVCQLSEAVVAMGTDDGVSLLNTRTGAWTHACRGTVVIDFSRTPNGTLLAATYGRGVYELTADGAARQVYSVSSGTLKDDHVYALFHDRDGNLWMGCLDGDLVQKTSTGIRTYPVSNVQTITQLPDGKIAVATASGIKLITPETGSELQSPARARKVSTLEYYSTNKNDVNKYVYELYVNDGKELWIGTDGGGVYVYQLATGKCVQITTADGLPSNCVCSITKDAQGRMLIATDQGLAYVDPHAPNQVVNVNYLYGLDREYSRGAVTSLSNGFMLYGTTSGALVVNPRNVQKLNYTAKLNLLSVSCQDDEEEGFHQRVSQMFADHELRLGYGQRTFDLYYESINLRHQFDIEYQYKVGDGEWSQPTGQQYIRFTNLEPGSHQLLLRSVSRSCGVLLDEVSLTIHIAQPWWNSWWMWLVYLCLLALAFYGAWRVYELHTKYMRLVLNNPSLHPDSPSGQEGEGSVVAEESRAPLQSKGGHEEGKEFIASVTQIVVDNLSDSAFSIDRLCREVAMSRTLFYVKLKSYTGKSPQDFIRVIRLERASALLRGGSPVTEVAALVGFDNPKYFSTVFKKYFGVSPSKYR